MMRRVMRTLGHLAATACTTVPGIAPPPPSTCRCQRMCGASCPWRSGAIRDRPAGSMVFWSYGTRSRLPPWRFGTAFTFSFACTTLRHAQLHRRAGADLLSSCCSPWLASRSCGSRWRCPVLRRTNTMGARIHQGYRHPAAILERSWRWHGQLADSTSRSTGSRNPAMCPWARHRSGNRPPSPVRPGRT
jgi:hypothetical protein